MEARHKSGKLRGYKNRINQNARKRREKEQNAKIDQSYSY